MPVAPSLAMLFVGRAISGITSTTIRTSFAYTADVTPRTGERRTLLLGLLCGTTGMAIYGLAPTGLLFLAGVSAMAL
jgi:DHA1 family tetracycline resistance protein-like MFS transporter